MMITLSKVVHLSILAPRNGKQHIKNSKYIPQTPLHGWLRPPCHILDPPLMYRLPFISYTVIQYILRYILQYHQPSLSSSHGCIRAHLPLFSVSRRLGAVFFNLFCFILWPIKYIYISWSYIFWLYITAATHRLLVVIFVLLFSNRKDRRREDE